MIYIRTETRERRLFAPFGFVHFKEIRINENIQKRIREGETNEISHEIVPLLDPS